MGIHSLRYEAYRTIGTDGLRVVDTAPPWAVLALASDGALRNQGISYGDGLDTGVSIGGAARTYDLGTMLLSAPVTPARVLTAWLRVIVTSGTHDVVYSAQFMNVGASPNPTPAGAIVAIGTPTATGWISADLTLPFSGANAIKITADSPGTGAVQKVDSVVVLSKFQATMPDGTTAPTAWPKLSLVHAGGADRPDDAATLRLMKQQIDTILGRYPRTFAARAPVTAAVTTAGAKSDTTGVTARYKVPRGPNHGDCTLYVLAKQNAASVSGGNGSIEAWVDDDTSLHAVAVSAALSGTTSAWYALTVPSSSWTANHVHDFKVRVFGGHGGGFDGTATVYAIVLVENAYTSSNFLVGAETAPTSRTATAGMVPVAGTAIVADYTGGALTGKQTDRLTLANNILFAGLHRHAILIEDRVLAASSNVTGAAYGAAEPLFFTKRTPTKGTIALRIWMKVRRVGTADADKLARFGVWVDGTEQLFVTCAPGVLTQWQLATSPIALSVGESVGAQNTSRWVEIATPIPVTPGTTYEIELRAGFVDLTNVAVAATTDVAVLDGVRIEEIPR
jgi:hypothetical protein